ncbi:50S ribosomal protein L3, partial [Candidatus Bathyarchaeota archaeon]|nr:50S ribosomal protein L3 [Candidatus Bathyarchaeota archaeon]
MGRRRKSAPKHGSLAYLPRGRAKSPIGKINYWPEIEADSPTLLGFSGYKVGMSYIYTISDKVGSPIYGQEVFTPITYIETPPMIVCGFRAYLPTINGLKSFSEVWAKKFPKEIQKISPFLKNADSKTSLKIITTSLDQISEFRALLSTIPLLSNVSQKKPNVFEVKIDGGTIKDQLNYLKTILGKKVELSEIFKEGQFVDVIAVTKGKGIQGPVKRWGVKKLHHKSGKKVRGVGTLGAWMPHYVMYTVPRAGQMGFHQRTERNKRILKIG